MAVIPARLSRVATRGPAGAARVGTCLRARLWSGINWLLQAAIPDTEVICGDADVSLLARASRDQQLEDGCFWKCQRS